MLVEIQSVVTQTYDAWGKPRSSDTFPDLDLVHVKAERNIIQHGNCEHALKLDPACEELWPLLSYRGQLWLGYFAAELRTLGIVSNQGPAPPWVLAVYQRPRVSRPVSTLGWPSPVDLTQIQHHLSWKPTSKACC